MGRFSGDNLGSDCRGRFIPSEFVIFPAGNAEPVEALSRGVTLGHLSFRGTTLTSDGEWSAIRMLHQWDMVIWG